MVGYGGVEPRYDRGIILSVYLNVLGILIGEASLRFVKMGVIGEVSGWSVDLGAMI